MNARVITTIIAFLSVLALVFHGQGSAPTPRPTPNTRVHVFQPSLREVRGAPRVDRALAPTLDVAKLGSGTAVDPDEGARDSGGRGGAGGASGHAVNTQIAANGLAFIDSSKISPDSEWRASIDRPTRERARLMVFLN